MGIVISHSKDFFQKTIDEFTATLFRIVKYMLKQGFERFSGTIRHNKTKALTYNYHFWPDYEMIVVKNSNMEKSFGPGLMSCLDKSLSPWTNMYSCPGHMCVSHKPWLVDNKYQSICCKRFIG